MPFVVCGFSLLGATKSVRCAIYTRPPQDFGRARLSECLLLSGWLDIALINTAHNIVHATKPCEQRSGNLRLAEAAELPRAGLLA